MDGSDKTQLVMLLDPSFAAAHAGSPFSSVFPGARHSETITALMAAVAGDAAQLAWFTDTFFSGLRTAGNHSWDEWIASEPSRPAKDTGEIDHRPNPGHDETSPAVRSRHHSSRPPRIYRPAVYALG